MENKEKHELLVCPYDKLHMVEAYRFQRHLRKCGLVHKHMKMGQCSFDATHIVPIEKLQYHETNCISKYRVEKDLMQKPDRQQCVKHDWFKLHFHGIRTQQDVAPVKEDFVIRNTECWDNDDTGPHVTMKLGSDGFKVVLPKGKPKHKRPVADVEGWLAGQDNSFDDMTARDANWEPFHTPPRVPQTMPKAMAGATAHTPTAKPSGMPKVFLSAIGRGHRISVPSVPQALIEIGRGRASVLRDVSRDVLKAPSEGNSSDSSIGSGPARKQNAIALGRGRARMSTQYQSSPTGQSLTMSPGSTCSSDSEPLNRIVTREDVTMPKGLSRIAASIGQSRLLMNHDIGQGDLPQELGDLQLNGHQMGIDDRMKAIRKLRKKVNEIKILQKQLDGGRQLDMDQTAKINNLKEYQQDLQQLESI